MNTNHAHEDAYRLFLDRRRDRIRKIIWFIEVCATISVVASAGLVIVFQVTR